MDCVNINICALHTWPEDDYVSLDIFVCNHSKDNNGAAIILYKKIVNLFLPKKVGKKVIKK
ncbi:S-adenosylmethionine decarboxylase [Patescibacteria group bacterium]|nr:S-adenosylmethionine decarboxylase [Patescibacteria group bacterium]